MAEFEGATSDQVFLSYARVNRDVAAHVVDTLRAAGLTVWWDADLPDGGRWQEALQDKLSHCAAFLVLIGGHGVSGWVGAEVGVALNRHFDRRSTSSLPIVPVLIGDAPSDLVPPFLSLFQFRHLPDPVTTESAATLAAALRDNVLAGYRKPHVDLPKDRCPFPGLAPYEAENRAFFFGRHSDTLAALECFSRRRPDGGPTRWLRIEGNSGVGKSSLVNAGVLPAIERGWLDLGDANASVTLMETMRPGGHPIASLARIIARTFGERPESLESRLQNGKVRLDHIFSEHCDRQALPLLVIDQFEELFTIADRDEALRLDGLLAEAIEGGHGLPLLLITTMRSDFLGQFERLPRLNALRNAAGRFELLPVSETGLREILYQSTDLAGLNFSDPELPEDIVAEARDEPGVLPLVSNLLQLLCQKRGNTQTLQRGVYKQVGGLGGALADSADRLLNSVGGQQEKDAALKLLLALVERGTDTGHARRQITRAQALKAAGGGKDAEHILHALSGLAVDGSRLEGTAIRLVTMTRQSSDGGEEILVDLIHETLLRKNPQGGPYWKTLWDYIEAHFEHLDIRTRLHQRAANWARDQDPSLLARGRELRSFARHAADADEKAQRFLKRSRNRNRRNTAIRLVVILVVLPVASAAYWLARHQDPKANAGFLVTLVKSWLRAVPRPQLQSIPPGCFTMGARDALPESDEYPAHEVCFKTGFEMSAQEITFNQYDPFAIATGRVRPDDQGWKPREMLPVINVTWQDAVDYAAWLSGQIDKHCRLPSEAEWEYSARAGTSTYYWWGSELKQRGEVWANCAECGSEWDDKQIAPVAFFAANPFGLYDTAGNVWEWVEDCWHGDYKGAPRNGRAWLEANAGNCGKRVLRGGSWDLGPDFLGSTRRYMYFPDLRDNRIGFRVVCRPPSSSEH
jgi:formylglycine-generating enzyme required for sulfatase activity